MPTAGTRNRPDLNDIVSEECAERNHPDGFLIVDIALLIVFAFCYFTV
ncbi:hypothetical protein [Sinomicrobium sp. M5D2P17]